MPFFLSAESEFASAHCLPRHPGKCRNLHGHNWRVQVTVAAETLDDQGMVVDFAEIKRVVREVCDSLDHRSLNDIPPFDQQPPTAENLSAWIYSRVSEAISDSRISVTAVKIWETPTNVCEFRP